MGYRKKTIPVLISRPLTIELEQEAVLLKEVQIRPGRVWGRQDTLKYDLTRFTSSKDRNVSDVLKKLPGINVEENGTIKYNGKVISNLYVEGMDVSGGRYNQINNNLKADAVQAAEVIEGHQPIKSNQKKKRLAILHACCYLLLVLHQSVKHELLTLLAHGTHIYHVDVLSQKKRLLVKSCCHKFCIRQTFLQIHCISLVTVECAYFRI